METSNKYNNDTCEKQQQSPKAFNHAWRPVYFLMMSTKSSNEYSIHMIDIFLLVYVLMFISFYFRSNLLAQITAGC